MKRAKFYLRGALGFGTGYFLGACLTSIIFRGILADRLELIVSSQQPLLRIFIVIVLIVFIFGLWGTLAVEMGYRAIAKINVSYTSKKFKSRMRISYAVTHGILIIPFIFLTAIVAFYSDPSSTEVGKYIKFFGVLGIIYGLFISLLLCTLTVKIRKSIRLFLLSTIGFTLGGISLGLSLWLFRNGYVPIDSRIVYWISFFVFGFVSGFFVTIGYDVTEAKNTKKDIVSKKIYGRFRVVIIVVMLSLLVFGVVNFVSKLIKVDANHNYVIMPSSKSQIFETGRGLYDCDPNELNHIAKSIYQVVNSKRFNPQGDDIAFCNNYYKGFHFMPNPESSFSDKTPTENGAFDDISGLTLNARSEILFATMMWDQDQNLDSPGTVFAKSVVELYKKVEENPENYPEGMSIKILTGNMPVMAVFEVGDQSWHVLEDLRNEGLPKMENKDIGWKLEVADYEGMWPHSHSKFVVIDGQKVVAVGFNYSYLHYPRNHKSGYGYDKVDLGIEIEGPVAQMSLATFDDLWKGSNQRICDNFHPKIDRLWGWYCEEKVAVISHPESVLRYYIPEVSDSSAFSLFRSNKHLLADEAIAASLASSRVKIDIFEVNFTLETICDLAIIFRGVCTYEDNKLPFMEAIIYAIEAENTKVRILVERANMNGLENEVAIEVFMDELEKKGVDGNVEVRYFDDNMHTKAFNVDDEIVVIGSHNFHYSAWGKMGLTEYSLATDSKKAIGDFNRMFEYHWDQGIPFQTGITTTIEY